MSNMFAGDGNIGETPAIKFVSTKNGEKKVAEISVFFDKYKAVGEGAERTFERADGGFWLTGSVWGEQAQSCADHLRKGSRVHVIGELYEEKWVDKKTGEERFDIRLKIDNITLGLSRIESVTYKPRREPTADSAGKTDAADAENGFDA